MNKLADYMMTYTEAISNDKLSIEIYVPDNLKDDYKTGIGAMINDPDMCTCAFKGIYKIIFLRKIIPLAKKIK